jgi:cysteine desulfurase/selenocysteine lyase
VLPYKFEAGTPHIEGGLGLGVAIDYLTELGMDRIAAHEAELMAHGTRVLSEVDGLRMIGTARHKASVFSFTLGEIHPHDIGTVLDQEGIAVRTGQHCAHPVMQRYCVPATVRASLGLYNTKEELDILADALGKVHQVFGL